jgi:large conductance mechanosensitive channel
MSKLLSEFKEFAMRGNVIDMAVGVVIGAAFGKIVTSLVDNIIMPVVGVITGGINFSEEAIVLKEAVGEDPAVLLSWGAFVQSIVDFLIIAFCIFLAIKGINKLSRKKEEEPEAPAAPAGPTQEELLTQIRDLLEKKQ